jgi:light-regulated signal transduction histidine kinase (bacteriophytochrome)
MFHHRLAEGDAQITVERLPTVQADRTQMTQLFQNLVGNALTYVAPGVTPEVHISSARQDDAWLVVVADNGIGIRPEDRERAFTMFQRLVTSEAHPGTGIGLAVCHKIVERHGGRIWIEDNRGGGSRFCLTLPDRSADVSSGPR